MIESVKVIPGCISCRNCENVCPDIFKVSPKSKVISHDYEGKTSEIIQAELLCPVNVIKVQKTDNVSISLHCASLKNKIQLTDDVIELQFEATDFTATPGQYVSLQMSDWKGIFYRNYSLTDFSEHSFTLTIKILADGRGGKILKKIKPGKKLQYLGGLGNFKLQKTKKTKVFFSTGTGLSPMISMLKNTPDSVKKVVYFGVREEKDVFYEELLHSFPNTDIHISLSSTKQILTDNRTSGRIGSFVNQVDVNSDVYLCGNPSMIEGVNQKLINQGHPEKHIYSEGFVMGKEEQSIWKNIILKGNIPGITFIDTFLSCLGIFGIPALYYYGLSNNMLYSTGFLGSMSITTFLFIVSWYCVVFVMLIRPIADLMPKIGILRKLRILRKPLGIISASVIVTIFAFKYFVNIDSFLQYFTLSQWTGAYPIMSRLTEITGIILLVTSNRYSQVHLGTWWKIIHRTAYVYFIAGGLVAAQWGSGYYYHILILWGLLFIAASVKNKYFNK